MLLSSLYLNLILGSLDLFSGTDFWKELFLTLHLHPNIRTVTSTLVTALKAAATCSAASRWLDPKLTFNLLSDLPTNI